MFLYCFICLDYTKQNIYSHYASFEESLKSFTELLIYLVFNGCLTSTAKSLCKTKSYLLIVDSKTI